jgi:phospholipase/lecithinase/hemolysin
VEIEARGTRVTNGIAGASALYRGWDRLRLRRRRDPLGIGPLYENTPNLDTQIGSYLGLHSTFTGNQLIVVWGGANDFLNARQTNPSIPVSNLAAEITDIANHGGKYFLVPNLPPLGITPDVRSLGSAAVTSMNSLSIQFDSMLASEENTLEASLGIKIFRLDVASLIEHVIHNPGHLASRM